MLVPLLPAVAGEVLEAGDHVVFVEAPDKALAAADDLVHIPAVGPGVDQAVAPVQQQVADGAEGPVVAGGVNLGGSGGSDMVGNLGIIGGAGLSAGGNEGAAPQVAVGAGLCITGDEVGHLGSGLQLPENVLCFFQRELSAPEAHAGDGILGQKGLQFFTVFSRKGIYK